MTDKRVVAFNHAQGSSVVPAGARGYLLWRAGDPSRVNVLVRSRGGRFVERWEATARLTDFRVKTIPPEHPLYQRLNDYGEYAEQEIEKLLSDMRRATEFAARA